MESAKKNLTLIETRTAESSLEAKHPTVAESAIQEDPPRKTADQRSVASRQTPFEKLDSPKGIDKAQLINKLNYINFQDGTVLVNFNHLKYDKTITLRARPQPVSYTHLTLPTTIKPCGWGGGGGGL